MSPAFSPVFSLALAARNRKYAEWRSPTRQKAHQAPDMKRTKKTISKRPLLPRERAEYSAIVDRPALKLPGGARLVFWTIVNLEVWDIGKPMARQVLAPPTGITHLPDVPNWSWHEYGMRVGVWRFFDLFKRKKVPPSLRLKSPRRRE